MISRVAESCFWLHRYVERAENTARLLEVNRSFLLDVNLPSLQRWLPVIVVAGEQARSAELLPGDASNDGESVQEYLAWDSKCPVSILTSVYWARDNARTVREVMGEAAWETLNEFWHWLSGGQGRRQWAFDRAEYYLRVRQAAALFQGVCQNSMLHEQALDFMRLGMLVERAGQTARMVDVKHHMLGPTERQRAETPVEAAQWQALLRSCSAVEPFFKRVRGAPTGAAVVGFLLLEPDFPRSVLHCLDRAQRFLRRCRPQGAADVGRRSEEALERLVTSLRASGIEEILARGLHEELTRVIDQSALVCAAIHADYFLGRGSFAPDPAGAAPLQLNPTFFDGQAAPEHDPPPAPAEGAGEAP
jgi:uncharacterized alpha-E superfamily protein